MSTQSFTEHRIAVGNGNINVREYPGEGPAFVLMHGFPDNLHIYDELTPYLLSAGRRVLAFDFLGFGASDKPGSGYSFKQQIGDLEAVVMALAPDRFVPVAHDSSGPTAINYTLAHPDRIASLVILNSAYDEAKPILWPELVELFATKELSALAMDIAKSPEQIGWILEWQQKKFYDALPAHLRAHLSSVTAQLITDNLLHSGAGTAFAYLAAEFHEELARNTARLSELASIKAPVKVIWGEFDPYLTSKMGRDRASLFGNATFTVLPGGHWLQSDIPADVAREMLS
jgi:haloalkane dehalogenase